MKDQHRATPEQWQAIKANGHLPTRSTIRELLHRIEALEAAQPPQPNYPEIPDGSLLSRVACADGPADAILEVAAWLREHYGGPTATSYLLEEEAKR